MNKMEMSYLIGALISDLERVRDATPILMVDQDLAPKGLRKSRKMHMGDAKQIAGRSVSQLRLLWEAVDPMTK